jgi:rfaE bifunctional protein kinase chain/domain
MTELAGGPLVVVGDVLLDREVIGTVQRLCPEAPVPVLDQTSTVDRPGGAGLAALLAADDGTRDVVLVGAFGRDEGGERLRELLAAAGVRVAALPLDGTTPEKIRLRSGEHLLMRLDRGGGGDVGRAPAEALAAIRSAGAVLVSDYGRGVAAQPQLRAALARRADQIPVVWDPHPRGPAPVAGMTLVTPNSAEADDDAEQLRRRWDAAAVVVTMAARGAVLADGTGPPTLIPAPLRARGDSCGAGDRFASAATGALADGTSTVDAVRVAVTAATAFVAAGGVLALIEENETQEVAR